MDSSTVLAQVVGAIGGLGGLVRLYRSQTHRLRAEIDANRDFADRFLEGSAARDSLHYYGDELVAAYIEKGRARMLTTRPWGSVAFSFMAATGLGFWGYQSATLWLQILLYVLASLFMLSMLGMLFPAKAKDSSPRSADAAPQAVSLPVQRVLDARGHVLQPGAGPATPVAERQSGAEAGAPREARA